MQEKKENHLKLKEKDEKKSFESSVQWMKGNVKKKKQNLEEKKSL